MSESSRQWQPVNTHATAKWSTGGLFLEALAERDFFQMSDCLEPEATMRALLPYGPDEFQGAGRIVDAFRFWFGEAQGFEVLDGTIGAVGCRLHVAWRLRVCPSPKADDGWHVIEQQTYLRIRERIEMLDLLCSGFLPTNQS